MSPPSHDEPGSDPDPVPDAGGTTEADAGIEALLVHLRDQRGFDFTGYKRPSLERRIRHRMARVGISDVTDYLDHLQVTPDEFAALFDTVLINVTGFFRDPETWELLRERVLPELLGTIGPDGPIRVWSAGCASGEEAYTLAITLCELLGEDAFKRRVKIYATDVDEEALATARQAIYPDQALQGLDDGLRERYFRPQGGRWAFRKDLRRTVIFGRNDLVQDAPISRLDLLVCRNTLMYLTPQTQTAVLGRFRYALRPSGVLVLGRAEMLLSHAPAFRPIDLRHRIFRPAQDTGPIGPAPQSVVTPRRRLVDGLDTLRERTFAAGPSAQLVLTGDDVLALANRRAEELLGVGPRDIGRPLRDLDVSYRPVELRSVVERARVSRRTQVIAEVRNTDAAGHPLTFEVHVDPLVEERGRLLGVSVLFRDVTEARRLRSELDTATVALEAAHEELQSTGEELETTNEELQSTVEELETTNEELQSTNEELETMNEELRSANEELQRINDEVRGRGDETGRLNDFLEAILSSLRSTVIVLDTALRVLAWNQGAEELWGLRRDEVDGAHLADLDTGFPLDTLGPALHAAAGDGVAAVQQVSAVNRRGHAVELHVDVTPLRRSDATVIGAVIVMERAGATSADTC